MLHYQNLFNILKIIYFVLISQHYNNLLINQIMKYNNQTFIKILIIYNLYLCLLHNSILSVYKKVIKMSKNKRFYLIYLIFYTKQAIKISENKKFYLAYLVAQQYKQAIKTLGDRIFRLTCLVIYKSYYKVRK